MDVSQTLETEEDQMTCLYIKLYHPQQGSRGMFRLLPVGQRHAHQAEDPVRFGRDAQACTFALADPRVSRKQLALQAFRTPRSADLRFAVQNLSQKCRVTVNGAALGYLERADLPDTAVVKFGEYEMLTKCEQGEAKGAFEMLFDVLEASPSRGIDAHVPSLVPVMETGSAGRVSNGSPGELRSLGPLETDETLMWQS